MKKIIASLVFCLSACATSQTIPRDTRSAPIASKQPVKPIKIEQPCFPMQAIRSQSEGWVQVEFSLDSEGKAIQIVAVDDSPPGMFEGCALSSIKKWVFEIPATYSQESRYQFVFEFKLG